MQVFLTVSRQKQEVPALLARLKLNFKNDELAYQSLTHVSEDGKFNNSRLTVYGICLTCRRLTQPGNSIVDFTVNEYLFSNYPNLLNRSLRFVDLFICSNWK
jgi:dsRNA-specific ribonuclease